MIKRRTTRLFDEAHADQTLAVWSPGPQGPARIYKNASHEGPKKAHRCLACFPRSRAGQRIPLAYGVSLVLCREHREPGFIASSSGRHFLAAVSELLTALGLTARRYGDALRLFVRQCTNPPRPKRHRPGSYAYPQRRQAAERVWFAGGSFEQGLAAALACPAPGHTLPSTRTVRRWWHDARWLKPPPTVSQHERPRLVEAAT